MIKTKMGEFMVISEIANVSPNDLVAACRRLYGAIDKLDAEAAARVGVSRNDLRCLNLLEKGPAKPTQIGTELGLTSGSVTALLDRLEKAELVERRPDHRDRRGVMIHPTEYLFAVLGPLYAGVARQIANVGSQYAPTELQLAVKHLTDACEAYENAVADEKP
ncbi:MAG: MarR family transcriptional regulator [Pseudomonadota bacterium]